MPHRNFPPSDDDVAKAIEDEYHAAVRRQASKWASLERQRRDGIEPSAADVREYEKAALRVEEARRAYIDSAYAFGAGRLPATRVAPDDSAVAVGLKQPRR